MLFTLHRDLPKTIAYGINLKERKDKRKNLAKICDRRNIPIKMHVVDRHPTSPKRGCLESHLAVIKEAFENRAKTGAKNLLIFEDDVRFVSSFSTLKAVPKDYDMLYFGGTVHRIIQADPTQAPSGGWVQMSCWTTHAYLLNLENTALIQKVLSELPAYTEEIDRYYLNEIHQAPEFKAYMCNPMIALQENGYSDIEGRVVDYSFMQETLKGLRTPEHEVGPNREYILKLPNIPDEMLPKVTLITPTRNRAHLFPMAVRNYHLFNYPSNKLEWVIVEDGDHNVSTQIPKPLLDSGLVRHIHLGADPEITYTIASKRNIAVNHASPDSAIILHMDDDDYYPPESVLARVKILMKYQSQGIECVGSTMIGTYNLLSDTSSMASDGMLSLSEASMGYTRKFWSERQFDGDCVRGEHKPFTEGRLNKVMDIPYSFLLIAFNHKDNFSDQYRGDRGIQLAEGDKDKGKIKIGNEVANFYDMWDVDTQLFIEELRSTLLQ